MFFFVVFFVVVIWVMNEECNILRKVCGVWVVHSLGWSIVRRRNECFLRFSYIGYQESMSIFSVVEGQRKGAVKKT